ncbi:TRAP transporter small permease [Loktanella sp. R86503]|uniref:TRAP transporter small permease n=1 Tax=Loktanella sp. R86503 TaxID=3093847 RepID=UPI0036D79CAF
MHSFFLTLSKLMAWLGGAMLTALILMVCLSVLGREVNGIAHTDWFVAVAPGLSRWLLDLGVGPVNGDFELVESGIAFSIFAFLPLCHLTGGHATVDVFTNYMSERVNKALRLVTDMTFAGVMVLIAWQLWLGMVSKRSSGQTTFLLEMPVWWAYALSMTGAVVSAVVACYIAAARLREATSGRVVLTSDLGADH